MARVWRRIRGLFGRRAETATGRKPGKAPAPARTSTATPGHRPGTPATRPGTPTAPPGHRPDASVPPPPDHRAGTASGPPRGRHLAYAPDLDGRADPGEIVWTWVAFEEDPHQGKDRPVLVVGRDGRHLLGLMLSSSSARDGQPNWFALGAGDWDPEHRPSWVRLDRVLEVPEAGIRREGTILDRRRFNAVATRLRGGYGWR